MRGRYKMDSPMEIAHLFFKNRRVRYARADKLELFSFSNVTVVVALLL